MKKKTLIISGIVSVIAIAGFLALKSFSKKEAAVTFETIRVEKGTITNTVTATGTIEAITTVEVGTQVSGILQHVYVDFNDIVKQGQVLARLDETSLRAQVDQSLSAVNQAQAQLVYQEATYNRLKVLKDKELIAQGDFDQAVFNYENSKGSLSNAKSALARAQVNLDYATITSPIDGVVLNRAVEEGQTVAASFNTPTLFTIVNDLTHMEVQTSVDEADIGKVTKDQRVEFTVDAYPDMKFEGTVSQVRLQPVTTNNVVTYVVILSAPNPEKKLMPGMTASATIFVEEKDSTLTLSGKAVRFTPDQAYLMKMYPKMPGSSPMPDMAAGQPIQGISPAALPVAGMNIDPKIKTVWIKDDKMGIRPTIVKLGIDNGSSVEILAGLSEGDEVVISMIDKSVKITPKRANDGPPGGFPF